MTDVLVAPPVAVERETHEVVTLANLRTISRGRSLGLGVAVIVFAAIELLGFGVASKQAIESTIHLDYAPANNVPALSAAMHVVVLLSGLACIVGGIVVIARWRRKAIGGLAIALGLVLALWPVALWLDVNNHVTESLKTVTLPVAGMAYVIGACTLVAGVLLVVFRFDKAAFPIFFVAISLFILALLIWMARGSNVLMNNGTFVPPLSITTILASTFLGATPLIYGSLSGVLCERSGVVNIAIEGQFMFGALAAVMVANVIGPSAGGLATATLVAAVVGAVLGAVLAYMALHFGANQIIVGVVIVAFCTAMVQYLSDQVLNAHQSLNQGVQAPPLAIPFFSRIPVIGPALFDQNFLVYLAIVLVAVVNFGLFRTRWGLRTRSVGEHPKASETVGISVIRTRYVAVILGGFVAGIGGAVFTIGNGIQMSPGLTNGEGFIALAIMIFGRWRPWGAFAATMLFGFTIAIGAQLNLYGNQLVIPGQLISALPYIITIAAVAGLVGRVRPPAADGIPYARE
jgi:simple sugar transport system permease protein